MFTIGELVEIKISGRAHKNEGEEKEFIYHIITTWQKKWKVDHAHGLNLDSLAPADK